MNEESVNERNLLEEMPPKLNNNQNKIRFKPGTSLPDVKNFVATKPEIITHDEKLKKIGIDKIINRVIELEPYENKKMNRYVLYQNYRLKRNISQPYKFGRIAGDLGKYSRSFLISALNKVITNGHRDYELKHILTVLSKTQNIFRKQKDDLIYKRVYIPKKDTFRPLGIPQMEGRMSLHIMANFFSLFLDPLMLESQHGFRSGRGTMTAWREILRKKILDSKFVYEFDLEQFFPSVDATSVTRELIVAKVPKGVVYGMENVNRCLPDLPEEHKLDESQYVMSKKDINDISMGIFDINSPMYKELRALGPLAYDLMKEDGYDNLFEGFQAQWAGFDSFTPTSVATQYKGLPQGAPTSPILSILVLKKFLSQQQSISYADDGIFYSNVDFQINEEINDGIKLSHNKTGGIKRENEWLKPIKFLGLKFDGRNLWPSTRNVEGGICIDNNLALQMGYPNITALSSSPYWGIILNRLYAGSGTLKDTPQSFRLTYRRNSWVDIHSHHMNVRPTVFNTSSYASHFVADILRSKIRRHAIYTGLF